MHISVQMPTARNSNPENRVLRLLSMLCLDPRETRWEHSMPRALSCLNAYEYTKGIIATPLEFMGTLAVFGTPPNRP